MAILVTFILISLQMFFSENGGISTNVDPDQAISDLDPQCLPRHFFNILFTHSLCYIYFSQFIHHVLFNISANQSLYQGHFSSNVTLPSHC